MSRSTKEAPDFRLWAGEMAGAIGGGAAVQAGPHGARQAARITQGGQLIYLVESSGPFPFVILLQATEAEAPWDAVLGSFNPDGAEPVSVDAVGP